LAADADAEVRSGLAAAARAIRSASRRHADVSRQPRRDALGSTLALHHVLLAAGIPSVATFPVAVRGRAALRDLPGLELLTPPEQVEQRAGSRDHVRLW